MPDANKVRQYREGMYERFSTEARKKGHKMEETKVEIWPSHILFTAYNRAFITVCIELEHFEYVPFWGMAGVGLHIPTVHPHYFVSERGNKKVAGFTQQIKCILRVIF